MKRLLLITIVISVLACTKNRDMYEEPNYDSVNSTVSSIQSISDFVVIADSIMRWDEDTANYRNIQFTKSVSAQSISLTMNFGDTTDTDPDKKKRSGIIIVQYPAHYPLADDLFSITLQNYHVGVSTFNGTCEIHLEETEAGRSIFHIHESDIAQSIYGTDTNLEAALELHSSGIDAPCWTLGTLIGSGNLKYTASIIDSIGISTVTHYYERGKCNLVCPDFNALINYGDGQEDYLATATSDSFRYIIEQKSF